MMKKTTITDEEDSKRGKKRRGWTAKGTDMLSTHLAVDWLGRDRRRTTPM
jgi:hypothetical protein